jgi:NADH:ubiquinone oxidoreductase subunit E
MPLAPDRTPTHEPLNLEVVWDLSDVIDERREGGPVTAELLAAVAAEAGVPLSHAYVAASVDPDLDWQSRDTVTVRVCTGGCQAWGAVDVLERFLALRRARAEAGLETFDVVAVACLNTCDRPTAVTSAGPHGYATHPEIDAEAADALVAALLDD